MSGAKERGLRRLAVQIAYQLPENQTDALRTLELARELLVGFIHKEAESRPELRVV